MATRRTKGPFSIRPAKNETGDVGIFAASVNGIVAECFAAIRRAGERSVDEAMGNARLFAAAPDMLEVLHFVQWRADTTDTFDGDLLEDACPCCRNAKSRGHAADCALAAVILSAESDVTLHRDAVEQGLAAMRARYAAAGDPEHPALRAADALTLALTAAAMRGLGESRDAGVDDQDFGGGFTAALGNVVASVSESLTGGSRPLALILAATILEGAAAQALKRITDPSPDSMNEVVVDPGAAPAGEGR